MKVKNKTVRIINLCGLVSLIPGFNEVKSHILENKLVKPIITEKIEMGELEIPELEIDDDFAESKLGELNVSDAVKVVKETFDYDTLLKMKEDEEVEKNRKGIIKVLEEQIQLSEDTLKTNGENKDDF